MKKLIITLIMLLSVSVATAQQTDDHLQFKNIPITGSLNSFVQKLKTAGFQHTDTFDGTATLKGSFMGERDCTIYIYSTNNIVCQVIVLLNESDSWSIVKNQYENTKKQYIQKYGEPSNVLEEPYYDESRGDTEIYAVRDGRARYGAVWRLNNGSILIAISKSDRSGRVQIMIGYGDKEGLEMQNKAIQDEI